MRKKHKDSFVFYKDWSRAIREYPNEQQLAIYDAIIDYAFDGVLPEDPIIKAVTSVICATIGRNTEKWEASCEQTKLRVAKYRQSQKLAVGSQNVTNVTRYNDVTRVTHVTHVTDNDMICNDMTCNGSIDNTSLRSVSSNSKEKSPKGDKKESEPEKTIKRFQKPTVEQLEAYAAEQGYTTFDAKKFYYYYESVGWVVSKGKPMKDWKAAVKNWVSNDKKWNIQNRSSGYRHPTAIDTKEIKYKKF
ncbi:MAG: DUF6291 domain-containing protein [Marinilabiliaceae bacterium]|nr:DUF6291 domain-containing protein [Marinilabiliaceae bacterium]